MTQIYPDQDDQDNLRVQRLKCKVKKLLLNKMVSLKLIWNQSLGCKSPNSEVLN